MMALVKTFNHLKWLIIVFWDLCLKTTSIKYFLKFWLVGIYHLLLPIILLIWISNTLCHGYHEFIHYYKIRPGPCPIDLLNRWSNPLAWSGMIFFTEKQLAWSNLGQLTIFDNQLFSSTRMIGFQNFRLKLEFRELKTTQP